MILIKQINLTFVQNKCSFHLNDNSIELISKEMSECFLSGKVCQKIKNRVFIFSHQCHLKYNKM